VKIVWSLKRLSKPSQVNADGDHQQEGRICQRQPPPWQPGERGATPPGDRAKRAGAPAHDEKEDRDAAGHDRERRQPAGDDVQRRQGEQIERERLAEDRIDRAPARRAAIPGERERRPLGHQPGACDERDQQRHPEADHAQRWSDRNLNRLAVDDDRAAGSPLAEVGRLEGEERSIDRQKRDDRKRDERRGLKVEGLPEDVDIPERVEPQGIDVVGKRRAAAQEKDGDHREQEQPATTPARTLWRPVDRLGHAGTRGLSALRKEDDLA